MSADRVRRIGLTGGIATGKSHVRAGFERLGVPTIDSDVLARDAVAPGSPGLADVVRRFGLSILRPDGSLDRDRLAAIVFADPPLRKALEEIVHPYVRRRTDEWFVALSEAHPYAIADIPLLYEVGRDKDFDAVIVVDADTVVSPNILSAANGALASGHALCQVYDGVLNGSDSPSAGLRALAFDLHNRVRPMGQAVLGASVGLMGNGMIISSSLLREGLWDSFGLAEDIEFHARLLERAKDWRGAVAAWEATYRAFPEHTLALLEIAAILEAAGDTGRIRPALRRYIAAEKNPVLRGRAEAQLLRLDRAAIQ